MAWTDDRVDLLRKLWMEGLSASQIAAELGGVTRNAVIGKIHRLGLSGRAKGTAASSARRKPSAPRVPNGAAKAAKPANPAKATGTTASEPRASASLPDVEKPVMEMINLLQLTETTCKFPVGDPQEDNFAFCGVKARDGDPYCEYHCRIAYQPAAERRNRSQRASSQRSSGGFSAF